MDNTTDQDYRTLTEAQLWEHLAADLRRSEIGPPVQEYFQWDVAEIQDADTKELAKKAYQAVKKLISSLLKTYEAQKDWEFQRRRQRSVDIFKRQTVAVGNSPIDDYQIALSLLVGKYADELSEKTGVIGFRQHYLPGGLLQPEEVDSWIENTVTDDGISLDQLYFALGFYKAGNRIHPHHLRYHPELDAKSRMNLAKGAGEVFEQLLLHADILSRTLWWTIEEATWYILTDTLALVPRMRHWISPASSGSLRTVITLEVDADTPPNEVEATYKELCRRVRNGPNHKRLSDKSIKLVLFVIEHEQSTWYERLDLWNEEHPKWEYHEVRNMAKDYHRAVRKLMPIPTGIL